MAQRFFEDKALIISAAIRVYLRFSLAFCSGVIDELEIELLPTVPEETLVEIVGRLQERWQLEPEPLSKFERRLDPLDTEL